MPSNDDFPSLPSRSRRAAYSVVEVARLCRLSRTRFHELTNNGVMPPPVYCVKTRRPLYTVELAARCVEVRETNIGIDGRYVMFYDRRPAVVPPTPPANGPERRRATSIDPLALEMIESLRSMGITAVQNAIVDAIGRRCPQGLTEGSFEVDLLGLYGDLRRPEGVG